MQGKQAKMLRPTQERAMVGYLATTRSPARARVLFLLSLKAGLRAKAIASLTCSEAASKPAPTSLLLPHERVPATLRQDKHTALGSMPSRVAHPRSARSGRRASRWATPVWSSPTWSRRLAAW